MPGILFLKTMDLDAISRFYREELGMTVWLDQGGCRILRKDNMLLGFCGGDDPAFQGTLTFFYKTRGEVEALYREIAAEKISEPSENTKYRIFNFFAKDPEGRTLEFQTFLHDIDWNFLSDHGQIDCLAEEGPDIWI